jgi:hypothetical protein
MADRFINTASTASGDGTTNNTTGANRAYASMSEAEAARQADLVTATNQENWYCCGTAADATAVTIDGWTMNATYYLHVIGNTGSADPTYPTTAGRHQGRKSTNYYRISLSTNAPALYLYESYTRVTGIQVLNTSTGGSASAVQLPDLSVGGIQLDSVIAESAAGSLGAIVQYTPGAGVADNYATNCVALGAGNQGIYLRSPDATQPTRTRNCTVYGAFSNGFQSRGSWCHANNCASVGATTAFLETDAYSVATYNAYDQGADPGTNGVNISAYTDAQLFVDAANGDCHLAAGSPLINVGVDLSANFTTDIDNQTRPTGAGTWDIGADEVVAGNPWYLYRQQSGAF